MVRVLALVSLLALAGCAGSAGAPPAVLGDWELVSGSADGAPLPQPTGVRATLVVEDAQVRGVSFCNHYSGDYRLADGVLTIDGLGGTEMGCDADVMAAETAYLAALGAADRIARDGDDLVLTGTDVALRFSRQPAVPDRDLAGTPWVLDTLVDGEVASSVLADAALLLAPDGTATGATGCRGFLGTWQVADQPSDDALTLALTRDNVGCPGDLGRQDEHVLAVLDAVPQFAIDGNRLTLTASDGRGLIYRAG